jgi:hypothetical protein
LEERKMIRLGERAKLVIGVPPTARVSGSINGVIVDRFGFLDAVVHLGLGAATGTPTAQGVALKLQTGALADGSDMADATGATITALTADSLQAELDIDLSGYKRYIRAVVTTTFTGGTTPAIPVAVTVALGNATNIPV